MVMNHEYNGHSSKTHIITANDSLIHNSPSVLLHEEVGMAWEWDYMNAQFYTISICRFWYVYYFCYPSVVIMLQVCDYTVMIVCYNLS